MKNYPKYIIIFIAILWYTNVAFCQNDEHKVILLDSSAVSWFIGDSCTFWNPTTADLNLIDSILYETIKVLVKHENMLRLNADSINNYYRQYICYVQPNGEKYVYVNALCDKKTKLIINNEVLHDLYKDFVQVKDGWDCYWNAKINLSKKTTLDFNVNGGA